MLLKMYRFTEKIKEYWETWDNEEDDTYTVHWGILGTKGSTKSVKPSLLKNAPEIIQEEIDKKTSEGFSEIKIEDYFRLLIEYAVVGNGSVDDVDKRHRLEDRMNDILGWTGLGHCDGGSIGSGTMEVCNFVVDFNIARKVIEENLADTEFDNFTRIYDENT
jgi:hypothetical protein